MQRTTMTEQSPRQTWLSAMAETARREGFELPSFDGYGMGALRSGTTPGGRFVTLKRRMGRGPANEQGVEWGLWQEPDGLPVVVAVFRDALHPEPESVAVTLSLIKGWLVDQWTPDETKDRASKHPGFQAIKEPPPRSSEKKTYWLAEDNGFGFLIANGRWSLRSREKCLSSWRLRGNGAGGEFLELTSLERLCSWLAKHWNAVIYGGDYRPLGLRAQQVAASRAYQSAQLARATENDPEIPGWWSRHAVRSVDPELPNLFFERQADEIVISWDAAPTPTRFYEIPTGEEITAVSIAIPVLRTLVKDCLKLEQGGAAKNQDFKEILATNSSAGYSAVKRYNALISDDWLVNHGFSDTDAEDLAACGTSRHPVVGLLRSGQGSSLAPADYDAVLKLLKPSGLHSFAGLRELAKGLRGVINSREPWESGYRLAQFIRDRLGFTLSSHIDIELEIGRLGVGLHDLDLFDASILGVCVGTAGYEPLVILNRKSPDACGVSGRRVTLAHELCHLLFDRSGQRGLARFEGGGADSDRLIEMRANAFAVELLVPMAALVDESGQVVDDARLVEIAERRKVSFHALRRHAENLRSRMLGG
jgi:Zn-dependent peptidase ImmA (M78 family)